MQRPYKFQAVDVMPQPSLGGRRLGGSQVVVGESIVALRSVLCEKRSGT